MQLLHAIATEFAGTTLNYTVTNRIVTVGGRTEDRSFTVRLQER